MLTLTVNQIDNIRNNPNVRKYLLETLEDTNLLSCAINELSTDQLNLMHDSITDIALNESPVIEEYAAECAISKVFCSDVLARVVDEVVQIHGGYGYSREYPVERIYRDVRLMSIGEGTSEVQRMVIARSMLS